MRSDVVMEKLVSCEYWRFFYLQASHRFFSVSNFSIESFHFIVVHVTAKFDCIDMLCSRIFLCPKLSPNHKRRIKTISDQFRNTHARYLITRESRIEARAEFAVD